MSLGIEEQSRNARKLCMAAEQLLSQAASAPGKDALDALEDCKGKLDTVQGLLAGMEQLVQQEPSHKRDVWKQKVSNQRDEYHSLHRAWERDYQRHGGRDLHEQQRAALLGDRHPGAAAGRGGDAGGGGSMDPESQMAMQRSHKAIDELEERGMAMLGSLASQRERLKGVHKKVLDVMNTLGVSNSLIRVIEKRQSQDVVLMLVGMACVRASVHVGMTLARVDAPCEMQVWW